jgi:hypothetical protein
LLKLDVDAARAVVTGNGFREPLSAFLEDTPPEAQEAIFQEFNSLSVVYQQPASTFVERTAYHATSSSEPGSPVAGAAAAGDSIADSNGVLADSTTNLLDAAAQQEADLLDLGSDFGTSSGLVQPPPQQPPPPAAATVAGPGVASLTDNLLDLDLGLGLAPAVADVPAPQQQQQGFSLSPGCKVMPGVFQEKWRGLPPAHQYSDSLNMATVAALAANNHKDFCAHMGQAHIMTMASGGQPPMYK